jgi:hypothetical protein
MNLFKSFKAFFQFSDLKLNQIPMTNGTIWIFFNLAKTPHTDL